MAIFSASCHKLVSGALIFRNERLVVVPWCFVFPDVKAQSLSRFKKLSDKAKSYSDKIILIFIQTNAVCALNSENKKMDWQHS